MNPETFYRHTEMCRVCPRTENLTNLYDPSNKTVFNDLNLIVYIENEDVTLLPKFICQICKTSITSFIDFKRQCEVRDKEMRENIRLNQTFKTESDVEDNYQVNDEIECIVFEKVEALLNDEDTEMDEEYIDEEESTLTNEFLNPIPEDKIEETGENESTGSSKFNCTLCNQDFYSRTELSEHRRDDHKQCTECPKVFNTYQNMRSHFYKSHLKPKTESNESFSCKLCDRTFKLKSSIPKHVRSFHNKELLHHCEVCGKGFFEIGQLRTHKVTHTDEKPIHCEFPNCGKTFKSLDYLRFHKVCHLPPELKAKVRGKAKPQVRGNSKVTDKSQIRSNKKTDSYICSYCGKSFQLKTGLDYHVRIHTNEKPHECDICHTMFRTPGTLQSHKLIHTNEKPFSCDICNMCFRQRAHLRTHKLMHQSEKKFSCQICNMSTKFKNNLDAHMRNVHLAERNHQCDICEESFFSKKNLTNHMLLKHKE